MAILKKSFFQQALKFQFRIYRNNLWRDPCFECFSSALRVTVGNSGRSDINALRSGSKPNNSHNRPKKAQR
jgi:hypothetical protein